jgi:hypothetical protein
MLGLGILVCGIYDVYLQVASWTCAWRDRSDRMAVVADGGQKI